jgi:hypothetical protein
MHVKRKSTAPARVVYSTARQIQNVCVLSQPVKGGNGGTGQEMAAAVVGINAFSLDTRYRVDTVRIPCGSLQAHPDK